MRRLRGQASFSLHASSKLSLVYSVASDRKPLGFQHAARASRATGIGYTTEISLIEVATQFKLAAVLHQDVARATSMSTTINVLGMHKQNWLRERHDVALPSLHCKNAVWQLLQCLQKGRIQLPGAQEKVHLKKHSRLAETSRQISSKSKQISMNKVIGAEIPTSKAQGGQS